MRPRRRRIPSSSPWSFAHSHAESQGFPAACTGGLRMSEGNQAVSSQLVRSLTAFRCGSRRPEHVIGVFANDEPSPLVWTISSESHSQATRRDWRRHRSGATPIRGRQRFWRSSTANRCRVRSTNRQRPIPESGGRRCGQRRADAESLLDVGNVGRTQVQTHEGLAIDENCPKEKGCQPPNIGTIGNVR